MQKLRMILAILLGRAVRLAARWLGKGGTDMPGRLALKLCPDLLRRLAGGVRSVAVTGTNGKTTSARIIEEAFQEQGLSYFANRSGANLISGVTTEFLMNADWRGRPKKAYAIIECDEAAAKKVFPQLQPEVIVVTNLFRDQLDRYGEVTHTLANIREAVKGAPKALLCLNADCSLTASLAGDLPNRVLWFGVEKGAAPNRPVPALSDASHCIRCKTEYVYDYVTYGHLGGYRCPHCGYRRPAADIAVTDVVEQRADGSSVVLRVQDAKLAAQINLPAMYNIYNAAGAVAAVTAMGFEAATAAEALARFRCGFGRMETFPLGKAGARMMLVKNPAGCNQVLEFLEQIRDPFVLAVCLNDRAADGTDVSWIWDADFEILGRLGSRLLRVIVSGDRAADMRVRVKYAGVPEEKVTLQKDYEKLVTELADEEAPIFLMPTYTAMLELRQTVVHRVGGSEFWE